MMPRWWRWRWRYSRAFEAEVARECALLRASHRWVLGQAIIHLEAEDIVQEDSRTRMSRQIGHAAR